MTGGRCVLRQVLSSSVHLLQAFGHPRGSLLAPFGYRFGVPGARLGTLGSHLGSFGAPLDPRVRQGGKKTYKHKFVDHPWDHLLEYF